MATYGKMKNELTLLERTQVALGGGATFTSATFFRGDYERVKGQCFADQDGTLHVDHSPDGTNWRGNENTAYNANDPLTYNVGLDGMYFRVRFVNGAAGQGTFDLCINGSTDW